MKFTKGLNDKVFDFNTEFGVLIFLGLRTERKKEDDDGEMTEVDKRVYDLLSEGKRKVIQVSLDKNVPIKTIARGTKVRLVDAVMNVMAKSGYPQNEIVDYITAVDIVEAKQNINAVVDSKK